MKLQPHDLTYIAEDLGKRRPAPLKYLRVLAHHWSAVVREGVIYGISRVPGQEALDLLHEISVCDEDSLVRSIAREALE